MKKSRFLGYALTLAATMMVGSAMGQTFKSLPTTANNGVDGHFKNFVELKSTGTVAGETATTDQEAYSLVQVGKDFLIAVQPDAAIHASYDTDRKLTPGYRWIWNYKDTTGTYLATPITKTAAVVGSQPDDANTNVFNFADSTTYNVKVEAQYPAAFGTTCSGNVRFVNIIALPAPCFNSTQGTRAGIANSVCVTAKPTGTASFRLRAIGSPQVKYRIQKEVYNLATGTWNTATTLTYGTKTTSFTEQWLANQAPETSAKADSCQVELLTAFTITSNKPVPATYRLDIERTFSAPTTSEKVVRYTILLDGINSSVSRKADYSTKGIAPSVFTFYQKDKTPISTTPVDAKSALYSFVYAIAPSTGPVYHLSNNVAK